MHVPRLYFGARDCVRASIRAPMRSVSAVFVQTSKLTRLVSSCSRYCPACVGRFCISNGLCEGRIEPKDNTAPASGMGYVVIVVDNMPALSFNSTDGALDPSCSVALDFGGESELRRVSYSTPLRSELEFTLPRLTSPVQGTYQLTVRTPASPLTYSARFSFSFFEDRIDLTCASQACTASSTDSEPLTVVMTNFLVTGNPADVLLVSFGNLRPLSVTVLSSNSSVTELIIEPPSCDDECSFSSGAAAVGLSIALKANPSMGAAVPFTFWAAPNVVEARFDQIGTTISIVFDQATDKASMRTMDKQCDLLFSQDSLAQMGSLEAPTCVWRSDRELVVMLGSDADISAESEIEILSSGSIDGETTCMHANSYIKI